MKPVVFIPDPISASGMNLLSGECDCIAPWASGGAMCPADSPRLLSEADAVIVRLFAIRAADLETTTRLKIIAKHGVGVDNIDVPAATARGIPVSYTPTANAGAVAEHTLALMLALARHIVPTSTAMREGNFAVRLSFSGTELAGKSLGVVGLGRIGRRVAEMARHGFAMDVRIYDPFVTADACADLGRLERSLDEVLRAADFLTLHLPLSAATRHCLNAERLKLLKPTCRIINTSRGGVIDEHALAAALQAGQLGGAALDVFDEEPLPMNHPLFHAPNTLLTPHISASTTESLDRMARESALAVLAALRGDRPASVVNPEVYS